MTGSGGAGGACAAELVTTEPAANTAPTTSMARETLCIVISSRVDWGILLPLPGKDEDESAAPKWARQPRPRASLTSKHAPKIRNSQWNPAVAWGDQREANTRAGSHAVPSVLRRRKAA